MRRGQLLIAAWAIWLGVLAAVLAVWSDDPLPPALLGAAALGAALAAGIRAVVPSGGDERTIAESSSVPVLLAAGITLALNGLAFGLWLLLVGGELIAFACGMLVHERRGRPSPEGAE